MFMLVGFAGLIRKVGEVVDVPWYNAIEMNMHHVKWTGFSFYDLIFPLFMFVSGIAIPYSIISNKEKGILNSQLAKKAAKRMAALIALGIVYNGATKNGFADARYASVLGQIGIAYFFAALAFIYSKNFKTVLYWLGGLMAVVTILQMWVPVPGHGAGTFAKATSINAWIDSMLTPGRLHDGVFDPEGFLCIISSISITMMGACTGHVVRNVNISREKKSLFIAVSGLSAILIALALSPVYPIIKKMWTMPFNLLASGISAMLFAAFYYVIDVKGYRRWTFFFRVVGMNAITIYLVCKFVSFGSISGDLLGWIAMYSGEYRGVVKETGVLALRWGLLYFLYKNKIFLRV